MTRLYKGTLRKLLATHVYTVRKKNYDNFHTEARKVREDFEKALSGFDDNLLYDSTVEKYELFVEQKFDPLASLNHSRPYSNLTGKDVTIGDGVLQADPIGYYKERLVTGEPTGVGFYEEYPDVSSAWTYSDFEVDDMTPFEDDELKYKVTETKEEVKKHLDELHK